MRSLIYRVYVAKYVLCDIEFIFQSRLTLRLLQVDFNLLMDILPIRDFLCDVISCFCGCVILLLGFCIVLLIQFIFANFYLRGPNRELTGVEQGPEEYVIWGG